MDTDSRNKEGRNDEDGYLLDYQGSRHFSQQMKERLTKRKELRSSKKDSGKPQADELYCYDEHGVKIPGKYDKSG